MRLIHSWLIVVVAVGWTSLAKADDKELSQSIEGAAQHLASNEWRKADHELTTATRDLGETKNEKLRAEYLFYSSLVQQQCSDDPKVAQADRQQARHKAISAYESYLQKKPTSGGALNNLAQLYAQDPALRTKALELYDQAVAQKDSRASAYSLNRAKLLKDMGLGERALQSSRAAVQGDRRNTAALSLTLDLLQQGGKTADIADFLHQLNASGSVQRSLDTGLEEIERLKSAREPVLIALAESLANPTLTELPDSFVKSDFASRLSKHAEDQDIGVGVQELLQLYRQPGKPLSLVWWRHDFFGGEEEFRPKTRVNALLNLARALGDRCRLAGKEHYECAEGYYRFAIDFTGATADPGAFLSLAEIYVNTGRQAELATVAKQYEQALFRGKMTAYGRENKPKIYQFHLALGMMYAYLGKWSDPHWEAAGAVFQLKHAQDTAAEYNQSGHAADRIQFPVEAAAFLSDGYAKLGASNDSARVRVEAAEASLEAGDKESAADLLNADWWKSLPATVDAALLNRVAAASVKAGVVH